MDRVGVPSQLMVIMCTHQEVSWHVCCMSLTHTFTHRPNNTLTTAKPPCHAHAPLRATEFSWRRRFTSQGKHELPFMVVVNVCWLCRARAGCFKFPWDRYNRKKFGLSSARYVPLTVETTLIASRHDSAKSGSWRGRLMPCDISTCPWLSVCST